MQPLLISPTNTNAYLELQRHRFGKKSERFIDDTPEQVSLFEDTCSDLASATEAVTDAPTDTPADPPVQGNPDDIENLTFTGKKKGHGNPI